jgi:hypothetical protein
VTAQFSVTTAGGSDTVSPTAIKFADHMGVDPGSSITSETLTVAGLSAAAAVSATGCQVRVDGKSSAREPAVQHDEVALRHDNVAFVLEGGGQTLNQIKQSAASLRDAGTVLDYSPATRKPLPPCSHVC